MAGCRIASRRRLAPGSAKMRSRMRLRSSRPSASSTSGPNASATCGERRPARLDDLAGDDVGVDDRHAERGEEVGDGGLAAGDATGERDAEGSGTHAARSRSTVQPGQRQVAADDLRSPHQRDPAGGGEIRAERNRDVAVAAAQHDECDPDDGAGERGQQDDERQHLPAHPRAERAEELEVAVAHAFLAGDELERPVDEPEAQVAGGRADDRRSRVHGYRRREARMPREAEQQAEPEQRERDDVGQDLVIEVDHGERHERPREGQRRDRLPVPAEVPGDRRREECRDEFDDRVARARSCALQFAHLPPSSR